MFIILTILFITILLVNYIGYKIMLAKPIKYEKRISIIGIIIVYIIMGLLTYYPIENILFYDTIKGIYGIN